MCNNYRIERTIYHGFSETTGTFEYYSHDGKIIKNYSRKSGDMVYSIPEQKTLEGYFATQKKVSNQLKKLINRVRAGEVWEPEDGKYPDQVEVFFSFPGGKQKNIDMFIAAEYGAVQQIDATRFVTTIPTSEKDQIALMMPIYVCLHDRSIKRTGHEDFLVRYNLYHKLRQVCDDFVWAGCGQDHPLRNEGRGLAYEYIRHIREERNAIYAHLVASKQVSGKWVREQQAYAIVKSLYPDAIYQFKASWLGSQSIDIMIPSKSIGIEHQGAQHYSAVSFFGGEEGYKRRLALDQIKREKCTENNIILIEWRYDQPLTAEYIEEEISSHLHEIT